MKNLIFGLLALTSLSAFAGRKDPCGVAYETGIKSGMFNSLANDSLSLHEMKLISKLDNILILRRYNIVDMKDASFIITGTVVDASSSFARNSRLTLDFHKINGKPLIYKIAEIDSWPISLPEFEIRRRIVKWARKIPVCSPSLW